MDTEKIKATLDCALKSGVKQYELPPPIDKTSYSAISQLNSSVTAPGKVITNIVSILKDIPELDIFDGGYIIFTGGAFQTSLTQLAHWLLAQSLLVSSKDALEKLQRFIVSESTPTIDIMLICGVNVEEEVQITDDVTLIPYSQVPNHFSKEMIEWNIWETIKPTAALLTRTNYKPKMVKVFSEADHVPISKEEYLKNLCRCLTLFRSCPAIDYIYWSQIEDWVPLAFLHQASSSIVHEILPKDKKFPTITKDSEAEINQVLSCYLKLSEDVKKRIDIGIDRINLALRRQQQVDKAIELRIALEALLAYDRNDAPISFIIRLRGSKYMFDDYDKRKENYEILKEAYRLGSKAVHGSYNYGSRNEDIIGNAIEFCTKYIRKIILEGRFPSEAVWDEKILRK